MTSDRPPRLSRGIHLSAEDGVCLMEYVSVIAGERFGPEPNCTDPAVAIVAGLVNDAMSDAARTALIDMAPSLAVTRGTTRDQTARVVVAVTTEALRLAGQDRGLARLHRHAEGHVARRARGPAVLTQLMESAYRAGSARHGLARAVSHVAALPTAERDAALRDLLEVALAAVYPAPDEVAAGYLDALRIGPRTSESTRPR